MALRERHGIEGTDEITNISPALQVRGICLDDYFVPKLRGEDIPSL